MALTLFPWEIQWVKKKSRSVKWFALTSSQEFVRWAIEKER
jgi:hypothetical protein